MRADAPDSWDLVVAAPRFYAGKLKTLGEFLELLSESIGESNPRQLSRVATLNEDDPALNALLSAISVEDGETRVQRSNFFGLEIEDAIILRAKRPMSPSARAVSRSFAVDRRYTNWRGLRPRFYFDSLVAELCVRPLTVS